MFLMVKGEHFLSKFFCGGTILKTSFNYDDPTSTSLVWRNFELQDVARPLPEELFTPERLHPRIELDRIVFC